MCTVEIIKHKTVKIVEFGMIIYTANT